MSWQVGQRIVADATGATVRGSRVAGGAHLHIDVTFRLVGWPWEESGLVSLVPQPSEVTARCTRGELNLGFALPNPTRLVSPAVESSTASVDFTLALSTQALVALETARDGGSIALSMTLVAHPIRLAQHQGSRPVSRCGRRSNEGRSRCQRSSGSRCSRASVTAARTSPSCGFRRAGPSPPAWGDRES